MAAAVLAALIASLAPPDASLGATPTGPGLVERAITAAQDGLARVGREAAALGAIVADGGAGANGACNRSAIRTGSDGRLTVLLLGSDYRRRPYIGERTDLVVVATLRHDERVAMVALPRDMVQVPIAARNGGGTSGSSRINTLYHHYKRTNRFSAREVDCRALGRFRADVATLLATEIDHVAMVRMEPFADLIDQIAGVDVDVPGPIIDGHYWPHGLYFPNRHDYHLSGDSPCSPRPHWCRSALAYTRSRYGTQAGGYNSDFARAGRSQRLLIDAVRKAVARGSGPRLVRLAAAIRNKVFTDLPTTPESALALYTMLEDARLDTVDAVVMGPSTWAYTDDTTPIYTFRPRLGRIRGWVNRHFGS